MFLFCMEITKIKKPASNFTILTFGMLCDTNKGFNIKGFSLTTEFSREK